ncbi:MAG: mechanosensitive ion channel family protein [Holophagaceae bacterium]|nr:mechanosensitive ion channel family protein [Holophagaceae bacterium]
MYLMLVTNWDNLHALLQRVDWTWLFRLLAIISICVVILLMVKLFIKIIKRIVNKGMEGVESEAERRAETLSSVINNTAKVLVVVLFILSMAHEFGMSIGPLLAGASIAGVALGFGAQTIVKDALSGFFLLLENQYDVGDIINVDDIHIGTVEQMTLRITKLRDLEGRIHFIPNGTINRVIVLSNEYGRALVDIEFGFDQDVDQMMDLLKDIGHILRHDLPEKVLEPTEIRGVESINHSGYVIRTLTKTARAYQWEIARELRRRILLRFREEGIRVPVPHRVIWNKDSE